jgi:hypothetical protein
VKISTLVVLDMETGHVLKREWYEYTGPVEKFCGGPTSQQNTAADQTQALSSAELQQFQTGSAVTNPFYTNMVTNPQQNPALAQQYGQQKAQLAGQNAGYGAALPSGFAAQENTDLGEAQAKAQAGNMQAEQMAGAQGLNPQAAAGTAVGANQSVMQAPLGNSFWSNLIGGLIQGGSQMGSAYLGA